MPNYRPLTCPECAESFTPAHPRQLFCKREHQIAYNNRQVVRGQSMVNLAQAWRAARGSKDPKVRAAGKQALTLLCRKIDEANADDRQAGRVNPAKLFLVREAAGLLA